LFKIPEFSAILKTWESDCILFPKAADSSFHHLAVSIPGDSSKGSWHSIVCLNRE